MIVMGAKLDKPQIPGVRFLEKAMVLEVVGPHEDQPGIMDVLVRVTVEETEVDLDVTAHSRGFFPFVYVAQLHGRLAEGQFLELEERRQPKENVLNGKVVWICRLYAPDRELPVPAELKGAAFQQFKDQELKTHDGCRLVVR